MEKHDYMDLTNCMRTMMTLMIEIKKDHKNNINDPQVISKK